MGCLNSKPANVEEDAMYTNPQGQMIAYGKKSQHDFAEEVMFVSAHDSKVMSGGNECYIISSMWLDVWLAFAQGEVQRHPGKIQNGHLVESNDPYKFRDNVVPKTDYRPISKDVWEYYFTKYGGGPVILFYVPHGLNDKAYKTGEWLKFVKMSQIVSIKYPVAAPERCSMFETSNPMLIADMIAKDNAEIAASLLLNDLAKSKMKEAKALDADINAANAEAIGGLMAKGLGKQKMAAANELTKEIDQANADLIAGQMAQDLGNLKIAEAKRMEEEANKAAAEAIALQLAADMAQKQMEEARQKEAEANQAAAEAIALQMAADMAQKQIEQAREAELRQKEEQEKQIMESFKGMGAKLRFRQASALGRVSEMEDAAACMLQGAWRSKCARRKMLIKKAEKQRLREEGCARKVQSLYRKRLARKRVVALRLEKARLQQEACARKLQCKYRSRLARKKVIALREKKQRLMEEGCAIKLQGAWRSKKARRKVQAMKIERQRLREEGSAIMVQSAWRTRKARKKVNELKARKQALMEEACAIKLQSRWRIRKAQSRVKGLRLQRDSKASTAVQRIWRGRQDRVRFQKMKLSVKKIQRMARKSMSISHFLSRIRQMTPQVLVCDLVSARDINIADVKTSDAYMVTTVLNTKVSNNSTLSLNKSSVKQSTLTPVWNEQLLIPCVNIDSQLVFTLFDHDAVGSDDFLGQNTFRMKDLSALYEGETMQFQDIPIGSFEIPVTDGAGKLMVGPASEVPTGKGFITFSLRLPSMPYTMCGWAYKMSGSLFSSSFKRRWVMLVDYELSYYEDQFTLKDCKGKLSCAEIQSITPDDVKGVKCLKLTAGKEIWQIYWDPQEPVEIQRMWNRKLIRSCPRIADPELTRISPNLRKSIPKSGKAPVYKRNR